MLDLRRLTYFVAVARELHFGRAARRLYVAQPAVSQQIRVLEGELGVTLFDRSSRQVALTEAGRVLHDDAARLLADAERAEARVRAAASGALGMLRVAYTRSAPYWPSTAIVAEFRARYPEVTLELSTGFTALSIKHLRDGCLDVAFVRPPLAADDLGCEVLGEEDVVIAVATDHPAAAVGWIELAQLAGEPVISWRRERGPGLFDRIHQAIWGGAPDEQVVRIEPDEEHMLRAVAEGAGVAAITRTRADTLQVPGAAIVGIAPEPVTVQIGLARRRDDDRAIVARFVALAREVADRPPSEST